MTSTPHSTRLGNVWWPVIVALVTAALCLPFFRIIHWLGDEGVLLHGAERMLRGSRLYIDFFSFLPPGGYLITAGWLHVFGISMLSARSLAIVTIVGIACFTYLACLRASNSALTAAFIVLGWVVMSQGVWTQVNHHWLTTFFSVLAAWAALTSLEHTQRLTRWSVVAGLASGAAVMITPTRGALAMLAAAIAFTNSWRNAGGFLLGSAVLPLGIVSYVIASGALSPAFEDVIELTAKRYADIQGVPFGYGANNQTFLLKHLFPVAGLLTVLACAQSRASSLRHGPLKVCIVFGFAGFVGCFPRPDVVHIAFAAPLVCPLLAYCVQSFRPILPGGRYAES